MRLEPWGTGDLPLLTRIMGDPEMTWFLGGPERPEQLAKRQRRYETAHETGRMFKIVDEETGEPVGSVGFWDKEWRGEQVYETGWSVLPEWQGRGLAVAGTALALEAARVEARHRWVHAFPSVEHGASNAICRKLGFELLGEVEFEYPKGHWLTSNDWRLDLTAG